MGMSSRLDGMNSASHMYMDLWAKLKTTGRRGNGIRKQCNEETQHKAKSRAGDGDDLPTTLISEAIAHGPHVVADGRPFRAADDANGLDRQDREEKVPVGAVVPVLIHRGGIERQAVRDNSDWVRKVARGTS